MNGEARQDVFERVLVRPIVGDASAVLVSWQPGVSAGEVVQVYVNGRLSEVVRRAAGAANETWLPVEPVDEMRVELVATPVERAWADHSHLLSAEKAYVTKAAVALVRDEALAVDSRVVVEVDGERDVEERLWGSLDARGGFGGLFGYEPFGQGTATGEGHGLDAFGEGAFGSGGRAWRWQRDDLAEGEHAVRVQVVDAAGKTVSEPVERTVTVERQPRPAEGVGIEDGDVLVWA